MCVYRKFMFAVVAVAMVGLLESRSHAQIEGNWTSDANVAYQVIPTFTFGQWNWKGTAPGYNEAGAIRWAPGSAVGTITFNSRPGQTFTADVSPPNQPTQILVRKAGVFGRDVTLRR